MDTIKTIGEHNETSKFSKNSCNTKQVFITVEEHIECTTLIYTCRKTNNNTSIHHTQQQQQQHEADRATGPAGPTDRPSPTDIPSPAKQPARTDRPTDRVRPTRPDPETRHNLGGRACCLGFPRPERPTGRVRPLVSLFVSSICNDSAGI